MPSHLVGSRPGYGTGDIVGTGPGTGAVAKPDQQHLFGAHCGVRPAKGTGAHMRLLRTGARTTAHTGYGTSKSTPDTRQCPDPESYVTFSGTGAISRLGPGKGTPDRMACTSLTQILMYCC